jgi:serine/threonine protein kinase
MSDGSGLREPRHGQGGHGGFEIPGFERLTRIGAGGSSTVYEAVDVRHRRRVAIKVLDAQAADNRRRTAFQREIEAIGRIGDHPNIVTVLGSGFTTDGHPYLVLPLFERGTYSELVDEHGPLTWAEAVDVGVKLASAVETVHRAGVVHRDIKPGNVFVGVTREQPLLADFGISSTVDGEQTKTQTMAVTFGYTAPEVLDGERPTPASDIYSLAMTIYRLIQGLHAYHAETPAAVMRKVLAESDRPQLSAGVPADLAEVVAGALAKDPARRPPTALALARQLQAVQMANGLTVTGVIVADEPALPAPAPEPVADSSAPAELAEPSTAAVETSMLDALSSRARTGSQRLSATPTADRPDAGAILAAAIGSDVDKAVGPDSGPADANAVAASSGEPASVEAISGTSDAKRAVPLDLPTVVTPRQPRQALQNPEPEPDTSSWPKRYARPVGVAVLVVILLLAVAGFYLFW